MSDKIEQLKQWYEQEQIRIKQEFEGKLKGLEEKELEPLIIKEDDEMYYYISSDGKIMHFTFNGDDFDIKLLKIYNYHNTEKEAQKVQARELLARKVFLARSLARKDGKHDNDEWLPDWNEKKNYQSLLLNLENNNLYISGVSSSILVYPLIFKDNNQISIFRKYISDEEIRQFLEG